MIIIENKFLPPKGYRAVTLLNFVFVRKGTRLTDTLLRHESIHWEQEKELLFVFFCLLYVTEFMLRLVQYKNWHTAYRNISFEREAYAHQDDVRYLENRRHYTWFRFIKNRAL